MLMLKLETMQENFSATDARLNDKLRIYGSGGWVVLSEMFRHQSVEIQDAVFRKIREIEHFDSPDHSSGVVDVGGIAFTFKISCDKILHDKNKSKAPQDCRIMKIRLMDEQR